MKKRKIGNNPVAKHDFNRAAVHKPRKGKGSYSRKRKRSLDD